MWISNQISIFSSEPDFDLTNEKYIDKIVSNIKKEIKTSILNDVILAPVKLKIKNKEDAIIARLNAELTYFGLEFAPQRELFVKYNIEQK